MAIHIHKDGNVTISSGGSWLPGCYEDAQAGRYAFRLTNIELEELQAMSNQRNGGTCGVITCGDIARKIGQRKEVVTS